MQGEIIPRRKRLTDSQTIIKRFKADLHESVQFIQEPRQLRDSVTLFFRKYVPHGVRKQGRDTDIAREYNRQREYWEKSVESLKRKLMKDPEVHRQDNMRIMQENVPLIRENNDLRREISFLMHERLQLRCPRRSSAWSGSGRWPRCRSRSARRRPRRPSAWRSMKSSCRAP